MGHKNRHNRGFTLIELSIVMVIIGLLTVAMLNLYTGYTKQQVVTSTTDHITAAQAALQKYQDDNGYYPCPADPTDPMGRATNCAQPAPPGIKVVAGTGGRNVRIGVMPVLDMSGETKLINGAQALDGWRNRLTYAVTENMAIDADQFVAGMGAIAVNDSKSGSVLTTNGNIIVLSHGEEAAGAYTASGVRKSICAAGQKDSENCNDDAVFLAGDRTYTVGIDYNDDFVEYNTATAVETTKACPAGSTMRGLKSNGDLICTKDLTCPAGYAFTGLLGDGETANCQVVNASCGPNEALISITLGSSPVCVRNMPGECPVGHVQNGTISTPGATFGDPICLNILTSCPANYVQVGTNANHSPICVPNFNTSCPGGQIQIGNDSSGSAVCKAIDLNACPAGQYLYGMNNGTPLCSGDRNVADGNCPAGQVMTGINGSTVTCGVVYGTLGPCTRYEVGQNPANSSGGGGGDTAGYGPYEINPYTGAYTPIRYVSYDEHPAIVASRAMYAYWGFYPWNAMAGFALPTPEQLSQTYQLKAVDNRTNQVACFNDSDYYATATENNSGANGSGTGGNSSSGND